MDDLLREFLTETNESLDTVDNQLVRFEQDPNNAKILDNIFRLVHTIKGTCGFLGLPRLEALAHAAETLMGKFRDGMPVTGEAVTLILSSIDRIKEILAGLESTQTEPEGGDADLIDALHAMVERGMAAMAAAAAEPQIAQGTLIYQVLERPLRPGEVSLDDLERAFRETAAEVAPPAAPAKETAAPKAAAKLRRQESLCRAGNRGERPGRQPVDPRQCRHARTSDDHGVGAGADAQPAARDHRAATRIPNSRCRCSGSPMSPPSCRKAS